MGSTIGQGKPCDEDRFLSLTNTANKACPRRQPAPKAVILDPQGLPHVSSGQIPELADPPIRHRDATLAPCRDQTAILERNRVCGDRRHSRAV
jgi:hypothetical protein